VFHLVLIELGMSGEENVMDSSKIAIELSIREATVITHALQTSSPRKDDELIAYGLYAKITRLIEEKKRAS